MNTKQIREEIGLTQLQAADAFGTTKDTIASWDQGRRDPRGPSARLIEIALKTHRKGEFNEYFGEYLK